MENKIVFGKWEAVCLLILMMGTKVILDYPRVVLDIAGTAGWILTIYITLLALLGFYIIARLYKEHKGKDIIDLGEYVGGKTGKVLVGSMILAFLLILASSLLRLFTEQMKTMSYTESPPSYLMAFFAIGMTVAAFFGLEPIIRFQAILVPVSIVAFTIYIVLLMPYFDVSRIFPLLGNGLPVILGEGIIRISEFSELLFLFLLIPFIGSYKNFRSSGYLGIILSAVFLLTSTLAFEMTLPYPACLESNLPTFEMGRIINYGRFFQRIEAIFIVTWATMGFMYLSTVFYFLTLVFKKTFELEYSKPVILSMIVIVFNLSFLPGSLMETTSNIVIGFRSISGILTFGVTIFLLIAANIKKKRQKHKK